MLAALGFGSICLFTVLVMTKRISAVAGLILIPTVFGLSALELLPAVVAACDGRVPVLFDSGVRSGSDVVKALGLGATMVGIGRPYVYGLGLGGVPGLIHLLRMFLAEADLLMAVNGYPDVAAVRANIQRTLDGPG